MFRDSCGFFDYCSFVLGKDTDLCDIVVGISYEVQGFDNSTKSKTSLQVLSYSANVPIFHPHEVGHGESSKLVVD